MGQHFCPAMNCDGSADLGMWGACAIKCPYENQKWCEKNCAKYPFDTDYPARCGRHCPISTVEDWMEVMDAVTLPPSNPPCPPPVDAITAAPTLSPNRAIDRLWPGGHECSEAGWANDVIFITDGATSLDDCKIICQHAGAKFASVRDGDRCKCTNECTFSGATNSWFKVYYQENNPPTDTDA